MPTPAAKACHPAQPSRQATTWMRRLTAVVVFCAVVGAGPTVQAGLTLELVDGARVRVDEIVSVTEESITVAAVSSTVRVERRVDWGRVAGAELEGERYTFGEVRMAMALKEKQEARSREARYARWETDQAVCETGCWRPVPGRVIGVLPDPLSAYADLVPSIYPNGVPITETPFALPLLRERRRLETIAPIVGPGVVVPPGMMPGFVPEVIPPELMPGNVLPSPAPGGLSQVEARVTPLRAGGGADVNALRVELIGLDVEGREVPLQGTADASLIAGRQSLVRVYGNEFAARPQGLDRLARWTRQVSPGSALLLELPRPTAEQDPSLTPVGSLTVRVTVPGQGVFQALAEPVVLRPGSPLRDALGVETGSRFLGEEVTSGGRGTGWPGRDRMVRVE